MLTGPAARRSASLNEDPNLSRRADRYPLADEAGTHPTHRAALRDEAFPDTVVTRAFTGRYARALRNGFVDRYGDQAPFGFPQIGLMTAPLQSAAGDTDDPHGMALWAGTNFRRAREGCVAEIFRSLT